MVQPNYCFTLRFLFFCCQIIPLFDLWAVPLEARGIKSDVSEKSKASGIKCIYILVMMSLINKSLFINDCPHSYTSDKLVYCLPLRGLASNSVQVLQDWPATKM